MIAVKQERRSTAEAVNAPLRLAPGASPMISAREKDSADRLARATASTFIARYREFLSVEEHEHATFDVARIAFREAAHEAALVQGERCTVCGNRQQCTPEHEHQAAFALCLRLFGTVALEWMRPAPKLTVVSMVCGACGGQKQREDVDLCLECADIYGAVNHDDDTRDALPAGDL